MKNQESAGREQGRRWAERRATKGQLRRLEGHQERLAAEHIYDWEWWFSDGGRSAYTVGEELFFVLNPKQQGDREAAVELFGSKSEDSDYVRGFAEGALDVVGAY